MLVAAPAQAAVINASPSAADGVADGSCSLREAITAANTDTPVDSCTAGSGSDVISLAAGSYELALGGSEDNNTGGDLDIKAPLTITGPDDATTTIDANGIDRVIDVQSSAATTISGVTITGGQAPNGAAGFAGQDGGGIRASSLLTLTGVTVKLNNAGNGGDGANGTSPGSGGAGGQGGGILADSVTISDSTIAQNHAGAGGASGSDTDGANSATGGAGGRGGGIRASRLTMSSSVVEGNLSGTGGTGANGFGGAASATGGGAGEGGGIYLDLSSDTSSITTSTIRSNSAGWGGDSQGTGHAGNGGAGGGLELKSSIGIGFHLEVTRSLFDGNHAGNGGSSASFPGSGGTGGGITVNTTGAAIVNGVLIHLFDSTVSNNTSGDGGTSSGAAGGFGGSGAGMALIGSDADQISHVTIAGNTNGQGGQGTSTGERSQLAGIYAGTNLLPIDNSVLAANVPENCQDLYVHATHSIAWPSTTNCDSGFTFADPLLAPLAANGGPTKTMALQEGSPAIDLVPSSGAGCRSTDQRGIARPQRSACDAGAFELEPKPPVVVVEDPPASDPGTQNPPPGGSTTPDPLPVQPSTADTTKPVVTLPLTNQSRKKILKSGYVVTFTANELGSATASLGTLGKATVKITKTGKQKLVLKLSKKAKKQLAKKKAFKVTLVLTVKDTAGNLTRKTKRIKL